jgi:hypothetical protein
MEYRRAISLATRLISGERVGCTAMKLLYKPFAIIAGLISAKLGQSVFKSLWAKFDDARPPTATTEGASLPKVVGARALEAATMAGVAATVDRTFARVFHHLTGIWPGDRPKPESGDEPTDSSAG